MTNLDGPAAGRRSRQRIAIGTAGASALAALGCTIESAQAWPFVSALFIALGVAYIMLGFELVMVASASARRTVMERGPSAVEWSIAAAALAPGLAGVWGNVAQLTVVLLASSVAALVAGSLGLFGATRGCWEHDVTVACALLSTGAVIAASLACLGFVWAVSMS